MVHYIAKSPWDLDTTFSHKRTVAGRICLDPSNLKTTWHVNGWKMGDTICRQRQLSQRSCSFHNIRFQTLTFFQHVSTSYGLDVSSQENKSIIQLLVTKSKGSGLSPSLRRSFAWEVLAGDGCCSSPMSCTTAGSWGIRRCAITHFLFADFAPLAAFNYWWFNRILLSIGCFRPDTQLWPPWAWWSFWFQGGCCCYTSTRRSFCIFQCSCIAYFQQACNFLSYPELRSARLGIWQGEPYSSLFSFPSCCSWKVGRKM